MARARRRFPSSPIRLLTLLILLLWPSKGRAEIDLDQVMLFLGTGHARILLVLDGQIEPGDAQSTPPIGSSPARARLILPGVRLSSALVTAYKPSPLGTEMEVGQAGIRDLVFSEVGGDLQVIVEMDQARAVAVSEVGRRALLMDLRIPGIPPDTTLPDADTLALWMNGLSFAPDKRDQPRLRPRIVLDPGHGGWDTGALGVTGTRESEVALALARRVAEGLEQSLGAEVILTRETDQFITLQDRAAMANAKDADLFVSIHVNAAPTPNLWGIETYYLDTASDEAAERVARRENAASQGKESDPTSRVVTELTISGTSALSQKLAFDVHESVIHRLSDLFTSEQIRDLGVKTAMFYVLVSTRMPSILFETSFLTNADEEMRLRTPAFQQEAASAIVDGIQKYVESTSTPRR